MPVPAWLCAAKEWLLLPVSRALSEPVGKTFRRHVRMLSFHVQTFAHSTTLRKRKSAMLHKRTCMLGCCMANPKELTPLSLQLRARREYFRFTQEQLAKVSTLSRRTIQALERSESKPSAHVAYFLAKALRLEGDSLAEGCYVERRGVK